MAEWLVLLAIALVAASGLPGALGPRRAAAGQRLSVLLLAGGCALGAAAALLSLAPGRGAPLRLDWPAPGGAFGVNATFAVELDALSVVFLLPVFLVPPLGSVYGLEYWRQADHPGSGRRVGLCYGLLVAGMALLVVARSALTFLVAGR